MTAILSLPQYVNDFLDNIELQNKWGMYNSLSQKQQHENHNWFRQIGDNDLEYNSTDGPL